MASNIKVAVRVRPLNFKELSQNPHTVVTVVEDNTLIFDPMESSHQQDPSNRAKKNVKFPFDVVCGPHSTNSEFFLKTVKDLSVSLVEGYNCSVFVYGATGAGKTYTMIGSPENPGLMCLTVDNLFDTIDSYKREMEIYLCVSYLEVYNENVYDLIQYTKKPLQLRDNNTNGVTVAGLTKFKIKTAQELLQMLKNGNRNRKQNSTDKNAESSRSHAVFQVYLNMQSKTSSQLRTVKLSMIDLAGSERASASGGVRARCKEGANINRSLLYLGNCINKLAAGSSYVSYRDSKLTRLLKDSLGGNCQTVMIANISPSYTSYEDTYNTLKYAARAKKIHVSIKKNKSNEDTRISQVFEEYRNTINELEAKLTLSNANAITDVFKEKVNEDWHRRLLLKDEMHSSLENHLLSLMTRQRVLVLKHRLRTRAFSHVAELAHRSFAEAMEQICTEDTPSQVSDAERHIKQSGQLDSEIMCAWTKWDESRKKFSAFCEQVILYCPELSETIKNMKLQSEIRHIRARDDLRLKLLSIEHFEINKFTEFMIEMPSMLKKLFISLKDYGEVPSALTTDFLDIMKKAKSVQVSSWTDEADVHLKFISNLDIEQSSSTQECSVLKKEDGNATEYIVAGSDDLTDEENKGTPVILPKIETQMTNDSQLQSLDTTPNSNSANEIMPKLELELNSTLELAGKMDPFQKPNLEARKIGLVARTNSFNNNKATTFKSVVAKALFGAFRGRMGFGSSLSRDGRTPFQPNVQESAQQKTNAGLKSVNGKMKPARSRIHPYSRLPTPTQSTRTKEPPTG